MTRNRNKNPPENLRITSASENTKQLELTRTGRGKGKQTFWKTVWYFPVKSNIAPYNTTVPFLGMYPKKERKKIP